MAMMLFFGEIAWVLITIIQKYPQNWLTLIQHFQNSLIYFQSVKPGMGEKSGVLSLLMKQLPLLKQNITL